MGPNKPNYKLKNDALCKKELDKISGKIQEPLIFEKAPAMQFVKINGLTSFWETEEDLQESALIKDILSSIARFNMPFCFAIVGDTTGIHIYLGTVEGYLENLCASYEAMFPGIDISVEKGNPFEYNRYTCGGLFTGFPTDKLSGEKMEFQIENICRGMLGKHFVYMIKAVGVGGAMVTGYHDAILREMGATSIDVSQTVSSLGAQGTGSGQLQNYTAQDYLNNLEMLEKMLQEGEAKGVWRVGGYYAALNSVDSRRLGNIIKASFAGDESKPEKFRVMEYENIQSVIAGQNLLSDSCAVDNSLVLDHPLQNLWLQYANPDMRLFAHRFQTVLNSNQLAALCQLPTKEFPGYYVDPYVEFDVSSRVRDGMKKPFPIGKICVASRKAIKDAMKPVAEGEAQPERLKNEYMLEKDDLTRHMLIIGITGGGKTNTSKSILRTLWTPENREERVPFLVIESAKREYWELRRQKGFEDLLVFTLGAEAAETSVKYRINPFETVPGISLQTHIDYLLSTFKAAFEMAPPMPYVLETAVYEVYRDRGWDIVENKNLYGREEYPTLRDLYNKIDVVVDNMGYHQELKSNVKAALQARINSLMIGGKGAMLNTPRSVPIKELLNRPVVMELEDLGDDETKSFVIGILLVQLYEYRKSLMTAGSKALSHVLMVEEAHRLLKNVPDTGDGGSRAKSVEFFCNLLAEIRTFGQGIIIADQIPTKLAPDTIKNTNLKIVHRTVAQEDRDTIGRAMNMSLEQIDYLSSLPRGCAAVYAEGDSRPKCVLLPYVKADFEKVDRQFVIREVQRKVQGIAEGYDKIIDRHIGCSFCEKRCRYPECANILSGQTKENILEKWQRQKYSPVEFAGYLEKGYPKEGRPALCTIDQELCVLGSILSHDKSLNDGWRQKYLANYLEYKNKKQ